VKSGAKVLSEERRAESVERGKSESNAEVRRKRDKSEERHQQGRSAARAMLHGWKNIRAGKSDERAEQDSGKAKPSSSR
jgi:hypothetical protein